jgi:pimeloyl-ACP methyl ester carboxylesterase
MAAAAHISTRLAYDDEGAGAPVVFLHGLTFDRTTWRPIVERLGGSVRSIAVDLPAHGESGGAPSFELVPGQLKELLDALEVDRPIVVGHSMSAGIAAVYGSTYPTRGLVFVDDGPYVRPMAEYVRGIAPALRGSGFADMWPTFENSLGLEKLDQPERSLVIAAHRVDQNVVLSYWEILLRNEPDALQEWVDSVSEQIDVPCLAVFGRAVDAAERERLAWMPDTEIEEWVGDGHLVHLVDPDRFSRRLRRFVERCTPAPQTP